MAGADTKALGDALKQASAFQLATAVAIVPLTSTNEAVKKVANAIAGL